MSDTAYTALIETVVRKRATEDASREDDAFMAVAHELVLQDYDLSIDEIEAGLTDGGGDGQIDAMFVLMNGAVLDDEDSIPSKGPIQIEIILIQSKNKNGFEENPLKLIRTTVTDLFDLQKTYDVPLVGYSDEIQAKFALARKALIATAGKTIKVVVRIVYASKGRTDNIHSSVQATAASLKADIAKRIATPNVSLDFVGAEELISISRKPRNHVKPIVVTQTISSTTGDSFAALVTVRELVSFLSDENGTLIRSLFDANVRDFLGKTEVNQAIRDTLGDLSSGDFWWFNNGVTIVASKIDQKGQTLALEEPLVVNGLQTSNVIHAFMTDPIVNADIKTARENAIVLVKIIVPGSDQTRDDVIKATNSQTHIPKPYLRGMDTVHRNIEDHLKENSLYYERRKNQYRNLGRTRAEIVTLGEMAQSLMSALLFRSADARGRPNSLIKSDDDYQKLFSDSYSLNVFKNIIETKRLIMARLSSLFPERSSSFRNDIVFHVLAYLSVTNFYTTTHAAQGWAARTVSEVEADAAISKVAALFDGLGGTDKIAKSPEFQKQIISAAAMERSQTAKEEAPPVAEA